MSVHVRVTPEAEADIDEAFTWYDEIDSELGAGFLAELRATAGSIAERPAAFRQAHGSIRRALLKRFPYCVYYIEEAGSVVVIGCLHARRDPTAWKLRGRRYRQGRGDR